jgi:hypothetical protein
MLFRECRTKKYHCKVLYFTFGMPSDTISKDRLQTLAQSPEFLTHQTTCASEMLEKTSAGKPLPPFASPACGLAWRQRATSACPLAARPLAATPIGGMSSCHQLAAATRRGSFLTKIFAGGLF